MAKTFHEVMIDVFKDTISIINNDEYFLNAIKQTLDHTVIYQNDELPAFKKVEKRGELRVTKFRTLEAAKYLREEFYRKKIAVLNFASSVNPGGGVERGSLAQEEALCRISTLYPCINNTKTLKGYYYPNRERGSFLADNKIIYSPCVIVFKSDTDVPELLNGNEYYPVDVITCAAPNYRKHYDEKLGKDVSAFTNYEDEYRIHYERAKHIIHSVLAHDIDILVLGAFGCGAFQNHPRVVAQAYRDVLKDYLQYFDLVEFAVFTREYETINYDAFHSILIGD